MRYGRTATLSRTRTSRRAPNVRREVTLAALPAMVAALLAIVAFAAPLRQLEDESLTFTGHRYQMLFAYVTKYALLSQQPELAGPLGITIDEQREVLRSSLQPAEYHELAEVESYGPARLARIREMIGRAERGDVQGLAVALDEAQGLLLQAREQQQDQRLKIGHQLELLQRIILSSVLLLGLTSTLAILRAVRLWRGERQARDRELKLSRELSMMASHELRRPLQRLALTVDLLQHDEVIGEGERARLLQHLQESAAQLALLSDVTRLEAVYAEPQLDLQAHDLAQLLTRSAAGRERVHVSVTPGVTWPVDADRLTQVIENLIENALKYSAGDVHVQLTGGPSPEIHVVDHGPGIPEQDLERVFDPYYRAPGQTVPGHGLGLAIARRFARAHGGDIRFINESGGGLRAVLHLVEPAAPVRARRAAPGAGAHTEPAGAD